MTPLQSSALNPAQVRMEPLRIRYEGNAEPIKQQWTAGPVLE